MAITRLEFVKGLASANPDTMTFTTSTTPSGSLIVGCVRVQDTTRTITVTDDHGGNTWLYGDAQTAGSSDKYYIFYCYNVQMGATSTVVTVTASGGAVFVRAFGSSYGGIATTNALDQHSLNTGTGTSWATTSITTTVANEIIVNFCAAAVTNAFTADASFTERDNHSGDMNLEDKIVSATGSFAPTTTVDVGTGANNYVNFLLSFADTPVSGVPQFQPGVENWPIAWGPRYV